MRFSKLRSTTDASNQLRRILQAMEFPIIAYPDASPIFVLGCVRSGTSAMVSALKEGAGIRGFHEGNVSSLLRRLLDVTTEHYANFDATYLADSDSHLIANVSRERIDRLLINMFTASFVKAMGDGVWLDKTPESIQTAPAVRACPSLLQAFPNARFIYCKRRAVENLMSRQRKFPQVPFHLHCSSWADTQQAWLEVRGRLGTRSLEVDQKAMSTDTESVASQLASLLDLNERQQRGIIRILSSTRVEQTQAVQDHRNITLAETSWNQDEREIFQRLCVPMMKEYGYPLEGHLGTQRDPVPLAYEVPGEHFVAQIIDAAVWRYSREGLSSFHLHPNQPHQPHAALIYQSRELQGHDRFRALLSLIDRRGRAVDFCLQIRKSGTDSVLLEQQMQVRPEQPLWWDFTFPPIAATVDITISLKMSLETAPADHSSLVVSHAAIH